MEVKNLGGRPLKYTPEQVEQKFAEYVEQNKQCTFYKNELIKSGDRAGEVIRVEVPSPLTIVGFCVFLKINKDTFFDWLNDTDKGLSDVARACKHAIEQNQLAGAAAGVFQPMIIARLLGLQENQRHEITTPDKITIDLNNNNIDLSK